jgi:hypothetical protein
MTQPAIAPKGRLPGLETINTLPIFFAINDGQHRQSITIIEKLCESYPKGNGSLPDPRCALFESAKEATAKIPANANAVLIFDDEWVKGCFSQLYRATKQPCPTLWGVVISRNLTPSRVATVVNQLKADFDERFFKQLDEGQLPWGEYRPASSARQKNRYYRNPRSERYFSFSKISAK